MTLSDQYRTAAKAWAEADGEARRLEAIKEWKLHSMAKALPEEMGLSIAAAEREVKSTQEWHDFVTEMVAARRKANDLRGEVDSVLMQHEAALGGPSRIRAA